MRIQWLGHACFRIEAAGRSIITDPCDERVGYPVGERVADIVTVSHAHWDHNGGVNTVSGSPQVLQGQDYEGNGLSIRAIPSFHDNTQGKERGANTIYKINAEDMTVVHLGDLGHGLTPELIRQIGAVDILQIPVGGNFTIDASGAYEVVRQLQPSIVLPMHFMTPVLSFDLEPVEKFCAFFDRVLRIPVLDIARNDLTDDPRVILLDYPSA